MKPGCIAVFSKTPGLSAVKTRLAKDIGSDKAEEIFIACLDAVQETLKEFQLNNPDWDVIWALAEENGASHNFWQSRPFDKIWTGQGGLGTRQHRIHTRLKQKYETVILIGTDCPHISCDLIETAITALNSSTHYVFGPATDGGYYLFGSSRAIEKEIWESVPYSCDQTLSSFQKFLGKTVLLDPLTDLDEVSDIAMILQEIKSINQNDKLKTVVQLLRSI